MTPSLYTPRKRALEVSQDSDDEPLSKRICSLPPPALPPRDTIQLKQPQPIRPFGSLCHKNTLISFAWWLQGLPEPPRVYQLISRRLTSSAPPDMPPRRTTKKKGSMGPPPSKKAPSLPNVFDQPGYSAAPSVLGWSSEAPSGKIPSTSNASMRTTVDNQAYRRNNLRDCGIIYVEPHQQEARDMPVHIASLVESIKMDSRNSPRLTNQQILDVNGRQRFRYYYLESEVEQFYSGRVFPCSDSCSEVIRSDRLPMARHTVPQSRSQFGFQLTNPTPDMLYGYDEEDSLTEGQKALLRAMGETTAANNGNLMLPFFVVEFKGADGSLWVAENQALGAAAASINVIERLMQQLRAQTSGPITQVDNCVFSVAMNGEVARLYVSWKTLEGLYYTTTMQSYFLLEPNQYIAFRAHVRNIIDWGKRTRLNQIRHAIDMVLVATQQERAAMSKARPPPSESEEDLDVPRKRQELEDEPMGYGISQMRPTPVATGPGLPWEWVPTMLMYKQYDPSRGWIYWDGAHGPLMFFSEQGLVPIE